MLPPVVAAAALGFASTPHCSAMCGPLACGACLQSRRTAAGGASAYLTGRLLSYAVAGTLAGAAGQVIVPHGIAPAVRIATQLTIALALATLGVRWALSRPAVDAGSLPGQGHRPPPSRDVRAGDLPTGDLPRREVRTGDLRAGEVRTGDLRAGGGWLAAFRAGLRRILRAAARHIPTTPFGLGLATVIFPCGTLAGALLLAASSGGPVAGGLAMATFAVSSAPGLALSAIMGRSAARFSSALSASARRAAGLILAGVGVAWAFSTLTGWTGRPHSQAAPCACERKSQP